MTAESLRGVICQRLLPGADGELVLAEEVLLGTIAVGNIIREGKMHQLKAVLQTGSAVGMITMDQSIFRLWEEGRISTPVAIANIVDGELVRRIKGLEQAAAGQAPGAAAGGGSADARKKKGWFK
jgi:twitching motility protein PilT